MKRLVSSLLFLCGLMLLIPAYATTTVSQQLVTYYPPPEGNYNNLSANEFLELASPGTPCTSNGLNVYLSNNNGILYVCDQNGQYPLSRDQLWVGNGTYMYPAASATPGNFNQNVGLGTSAPPIANLDVGPGPNTPVYMHLAGSSNGGTPYPGAGAYLNWNIATGTGETDFINNKGAGTGGGFNFYTTPAAGTPLTNLTSGATFLTGTGDANVAIGTTGVTTINGTLHITGAPGAAPPDLVVNSRIQTGDAGGSGGIWLTQNFSMFVGQLGTSEGFWNNITGWSLMVNPNGRVGIGVNDTAPGALLELEGTPTASGNLNGLTIAPIKACANSTKAACGLVAFAQSGDNNYYAAAGP